MTINRYHGQPLPISVRFPSNPLTPYGKTYSDIEDISMNLKKVLASDADALYLQKKQSTGGVSLVEARHEFIMTIAASDYSLLTVNDTYYLTVNVKVTGIASYIELDLVDRTVEISPDVNRE